MRRARSNWKTAVAVAMAVIWLFKALTFPVWGLIRWKWRNGKISRLAANLARTIDHLEPLLTETQQDKLTTAVNHAINPVDPRAKLTLEQALTRLYKKDMQSFKRLETRVLRFA